MDRYGWTNPGDNTGLFGAIFQLAAGLQALAYEQLWLKEELSVFFQPLFSQKITGPAKRGKPLRPLFQTMTMNLENHYDAFGKPLRRF
jgi:hypothetical protein